MKVFTKDEWSAVCNENARNVMQMDRLSKASGLYDIWHELSSDDIDAIEVYTDYAQACMRAKVTCAPFLSVAGSDLCIISNGAFSRIREMRCLHNMEIIEAVKSCLANTPSLDTSSQATFESPGKRAVSDKRITTRLVIHVSSRSDLHVMKTGGLDLTGRVMPSTSDTEVSERDRDRARSVLLDRRPVCLPLYATIPYIYAAGIKDYDSRLIMGLECSLSTARIDDEMSGAFLAVKGISPRLDRVAVFSRTGVSCGMLSRQDALTLKAWRGVVEVASRGCDSQRRSVFHIMTTLNQAASDVVLKFKV